MINVISVGCYHKKTSYVLRLCNFHHFWMLIVCNFITQGCYLYLVGKSLDQSLDLSGCSRECKTNIDYFWSIFFCVLIILQSFDDTWSPVRIPVATKTFFSQYCKNSNNSLKNLLWKDKFFNLFCKFFKYSMKTVLVTAGIWTGN